MNKTILKIGIILLTIMIILLIIYPLIEFDIGGKIIKFSYSDDISTLETYTCYTESYVYNEDRNISIYNFDFHKVLFFYIITFEYKKGNVCDREYLLEEQYINNFLKNADIKYNQNNIDLSKLIKGKTAIVSNKRYFGNNYENSIDYILDGKYETLYVFYENDLLVIQVGLSDEGPKFIAYKW